MQNFQKIEGKDIDINKGYILYKKLVRLHGVTGSHYIPCEHFAGYNIIFEISENNDKIEGDILYNTEKECEERIEEIRTLIINQKKEALNKCKHYNKTEYLKFFEEHPFATMFGGNPSLPERCFYFCKRYKECYCKDLYENDNINKVIDKKETK